MSFPRAAAISFMAAPLTNLIISNWFNPAAFAVPAKGTWGNLGRYAARGPGYYEIDSALEKRFEVTENKSVSFRAEAFNVTNTAKFDTNFVTASNVSLTLGSPSTWGNYAETLTKPRVLQFSLRYAF